MAISWPWHFFSSSQLLFLGLVELLPTLLICVFCALICVCTLSVILDLLILTHEFYLYIQPEKCRGESSARKTKVKSIIIEAVDAYQL